MQLNTAQRQILIWLVSLVTVSILMHYFGSLMMWLLGLTLAWSLLDLRFANRLQTGVDKAKKLTDKVEKAADKVEDLIL